VNIQRTFSGNSEDIQWTFSEHSVNIQWQFREHALNSQWTFSEHLVNILWTFRERALFTNSRYWTVNINSKGVNTSKIYRRSVWKCQYNCGFIVTVYEWLQSTCVFLLQFISDYSLLIATAVLVALLQQMYLYRRRWSFGRSSDAGNSRVSQHITY
jgi:hypothetical protein